MSIFIYRCIALYANEGACFTSDIAIDLRVAVLKLWGHSDTLWWEQTLCKRFVDVTLQVKQEI